MEVLFFGSFRAVLGTALVASCNALSIQRSAYDVITAAREIADTTAADQNDGVLLQIVTDTRNIGRRLQSVCQSDSRDFAKRGVRLFRADGGNLHRT